MQGMYDPQVLLLFSLTPEPTSIPVGRNRSSTMVGPGAHPDLASAASRPSQLASTPRNITEPSSSAAAAALSNHLASTAQNAAQIDLSPTSSKRPRLASSKTSHARLTSWPSVPAPPSMTHNAPSAPVVPTRGSLDPVDAPLFLDEKIKLLLYTYRPNNLAQHAQPAPLPSINGASAAAPSCVHFSYEALPWPVRAGDYLQIRRIERDDTHSMSLKRGLGMSIAGPSEVKGGGEALKQIAPGSKRDAYIFRVGDDCPNIPINQIQVPDNLAAAFRFQHRLEIEVSRVRPFCIPRIRLLT